MFKKTFLLCILLAQACWPVNQCSTPLLTHVDANDEREFQNVYQCFPTGSQILQSVQKLDKAASSTTSATFVATTTSLSITPISASSQIKITVTGTLLENSAGDIAYATIFKNGSNLDTTGSGFASNTVTGGGVVVTPVGITYYDSPGTTASITYAVAIRSSIGGSTTFWNNNTGTAVLIVEEIGQ